MRKLTNKRTFLSYNSEEIVAAIDKIYGTKAQFDEFYSWCNENKPDVLKHFYIGDSDWDDGKQHAITNFPMVVDKWMLKNCSIVWVKEYIKYQYNIDGIYDLMDFLGIKED
jgi:hypothetical protein